MRGEEILSLRTQEYEAKGYPKDQALKVAVDVIGGFLLENDMTEHLALHFPWQIRHIQTTFSAFVPI